MRIGRNALALEDYVLSIQYFTRAAQAKPYLAEPYLMRAIARLNLEDFTGAEEDATLCIQRNPFITDAYEVRGVARQNLGKKEQAISDYDSALKNLPDNRNLLYNKAFAQSDMGDYDGSLATFQHLTEAYPGYDGGYMGRARVQLLRGDSLQARADAEKALSINPHNTGARLLRADLRMNTEQDYAGARTDLDTAIIEQPLRPELYVTRSYLDYRLNDYNSAFSDLDRAIELDPANVGALFNRGVLRSQVRDLNRAADDFTRVLQLQPKDYRALYNRALVKMELEDYAGAINDLQAVVARYPDFGDAYFIMSDLLRRLGRERASTQALNRSRALLKTRVKDYPFEGSKTDENAELTQEQMKSIFTALKTGDTQSSEQELTYNNPDIKGRVQDRNVAIDMLPFMSVTYYTSPTELKPSGDFMPELEQLNRTGLLPAVLQAAVNVPVMSDPDDVKEHFTSIEKYEKLITQQKPRSIDLLALAMDYMTVRDFENAIKNLDRVVNITPDLAVGYFIRANARFSNSDPSSPNHKIMLQQAISDLDTAISLSPAMGAAYYNRAYFQAQAGEVQKALKGLTKAIELRPDFGEAYFNRGYLFLSQGNRAAAERDLSRAGTLGIIQAYNLLKKIRR